MQIVELFENIFWTVAQNMALLIMPIISIIIIIKTINYFIVKATE